MRASAGSCESSGGAQGKSRVDFLDLPPLAAVRGTVRLPGSKSISNRTLLLAALAQGTTLVRDVLDSDDTRYMLKALRDLGVACQETGDGCVRVEGAGGRFPAREAELFLGNAGTAFRPLTAVLAVTGGEYRLSGVPRMHERPIGDLVEALTRIGARVDYLGQDGYPPLAIHPGTISIDGPVSVRGSVSSQFLTALLMALPLTGKAAQVTVEGELVSRPYVEITLATMQRFGVAVERRGWNAYDVPRARYRSPGEIYVEGDASSASYFLAAGVVSGLTGGGPVRVTGIGRESIQGDVRFTEVLERMGGRISTGSNWIEATAGERAAQRGRLEAVDADFNHIPDAAMTAAMLALFADGTSRLSNIASWRVKETDRIAAMAAELRKLGATVEEGPDFLAITPPPGGLVPGAVIDTYDDHRMAMCFSLAALGGVPVRINDPGCVAKTFPDYFSVFATIAETRA
jgi:3-phosphoshikimate 1-carboxyvinyltransferase